MISNIVIITVLIAFGCNQKNGEKIEGLFFYKYGNQVDETIHFSITKKVDLYDVYAYVAGELYTFKNTKIECSKVDKTCKFFNSATGKDFLTVKFVTDFDFIVIRVIKEINETGQETTIIQSNTEFTKNHKSRSKYVYE